MQIRFGWEPYIPAFFKTNSLFAIGMSILRFIRTPISFWHRTSEAMWAEIITAGALVSMIWNRPEMSLFIDLGTNGELAFGNSDFMVSCACSAGPAFEGGDISCGHACDRRAIEKCTIDPETNGTFVPCYRDEGTKPIGLCGSVSSM